VHDAIHGGAESLCTPLWCRREDAGRGAAAFVFVSAGPRRSVVAGSPPSAAHAAELRGNPNRGWHCSADASNIGTGTFMEYETMDAIDAPVSDGVSLRAMTADDLADAHALTDQLRWPHRPADWEQVFRHAEGLVAERDGRVVGTGLRWRWGPRHATIGLVVVSPACQGRRIGHRLMSSLLAGLEDCSVLLHATADGRGLYERLGFVRIGEIRQHQGMAQPTLPIALGAGWRLRPATESDLAALRSLDAASRGMPREALIEELFRASDVTVVLDRDGSACGFAMLRRFGKGLILGPVVASHVDGAKALIAHLVGLSAGKFVRIDVDGESGLTDWLAALGLKRVDAPTVMVRGAALPTPATLRAFALVTQALG
jgi:predicted N-acetyltransferase YhbS